MNLQAEFTSAALKMLRQMPPGSTAVYNGQATIYLRKRADNEWVFESADTGLHVVTDGYLASRNPVINEETTP